MNYNKIMIVAHPDDEILWGSKCFENESDWLVICLTNQENKLRFQKFKQVMKLYKLESIIFNFPDTGRLDWDVKTYLLITKKLKEYINKAGIKKIVTHNPDGEYGHPAHKLVSKLVTENISDSKKLYYFNFLEINNKPFSSINVKALSIYYDFYFLNKLFFSFNKSFRFLISFFYRFTRKLTLNLLPSNIFLEQTDVDHINLSKFQSTIICKDFISCKELVHEISEVKYEIENANDVYLNNKKLYDKYIDRKYIVTEFLPSCEGKTLSVGCHTYNKLDAFCLPEPENFETIDILDKWKIYGSPYKHQTIDFLKYNPDYKLSNIILFGVMGIPYKSENDDDTYTMFNKDSEIVDKVDKLLSKGGRVLFGPDYSIDVSKSKKEKIDYWKNFNKSNKILSKNFKLINQFYTDVNFVIVCEKIK